jgi:hypothetical protein
MNTLPRKKLPIGIQTFRKIREDNCYYVDKTSQAMDLIEQGSCYFLSRPRRFGKSLFLDTLKELFEGSKELFDGLAAETRWDWGKQYPVIRISFGAGVVDSRAKLNDSIDGQLLQHEVAAGLQQQSLSLNRRFSKLIAHLHAQTGQRVVVLVDEYDKPILDRIEQPELALDIREGLKDLYSVIKDSDAHIRFAMLTGVSKFSKVSLFSGLNNLKDITLDARYSDICGYTEADVNTVFAERMRHFAPPARLTRIRRLPALQCSRESQHPVNGQTGAFAQGRVHMNGVGTVLQHLGHTGQAIHGHPGAMGAGWQTRHKSVAVLVAGAIVLMVNRTVAPVE